MPDIVKRLREAAKFGGHYADAADEIERLRTAIWAWYDDQHCSHAGLAKIAKEMPIPYVPRQGLDKSPKATTPEVPENG